MPSHKVHKAIDSLVFGKEYAKVHKMKDLPAKWLGPRHRKLLHNTRTNLMLAIILGDPRAAASGQLHDSVDKFVSKLPRETREILEILAAKRRRVQL